MTDPLLDFGDRLLSGLNRAGVSSASKWAEMYRRTKDNKPWSLARYPWSREWHDAQCERGCILKCAQMSATETMLAKGMFANDVLKRDVLYVLPNKTPDASDFSSARFDAAVIASPYLSQLYDRSNVGHKRTGVANFYIRGGQSRAGLKSVPVYLLILDELDEMNQENIPLAYERTSGQLEKSIWELSTPTITDHGIAKSFDESTQEHFFFSCPLCSKMTELVYPECLEIIGDDPNSIETLKESFLKCKECNGRLSHLDKMHMFKDAQWVPSITGRDKRGFYINQLYSMTVTPGEIAIAAIKARMTAIDEQEFFNSKLGLPHTPNGAKLNDALLKNCMVDYLNGAPAGNKIVTMGVDVGSWLHYEIDEWTLGESVAGDVNVNAIPRALKIDKARDFQELDTLMEEYRVNHCVIDAHPERRKAKEFADRFWGRVSMCIYAQGISGKLLNVHSSQFGEPFVSVDRTSWMDQALGRIKTARYVIPRNVYFEFLTHMCVPARIMTRDSSGNPIATWLTPSGKADHHAHARNYAEIALPLACSAGQNYDMESPL